MRPPSVFVRPLLHEEAVRLKRLSRRAKHECTRQRAAVLLASNVRMSVPQIAEMWRTDPAFGERVCLRRLKRGADDLDALTLEDLVEGTAELAVAIVDQEPGRCRPLGQ